MSVAPVQLHISDGRSQDQRCLPALSGDYFKPNEWRFDQLLAMAVDYARLVKFYQLDLRADSQWQQYFQDDEAVLLASMLALDPAQLERSFEARLAQHVPDEHWVIEDMAFDITRMHNGTPCSALLLARLLDHWLASFSTAFGQAGQEVTQLLESVLRGLDKEVLAMLEIAPQFGPLLKTRFSPRFIELVLWSGDELQGAAATPAAATRELGAGEVSPGNARIAARGNFHAFLQALVMLQQGAMRMLPVSLTSGQHDPATGLLIAFLQLFQKMQIRLNQFGQAHLDFYYQQVLQIQQKPYFPDSAFLVIRPGPGVRLVVVDAGCQFVAGQDANEQDIIYQADESVVLNDARVQALHTLYFPRSLPQTQTQPQTLACYQDEISANPDMDHEKLPPLPLMGAPKPGNPLNTAQPARFGFALASKVLLMREGWRRVRVMLQYRPDAQNGLRASLQQLALELDGKANVTDRAHLNDVFIKLFRSMFRISLSTASGWHQVSEYRPSYRGLNRELPNDCVMIEFLLAPDVPPITPWQAALHGDAFDTVLPVLRFEMTQNEYRYPYDLLGRWILQEIRLEVEVDGCRQLLLHNQIGQLSALSPFMPFGPLPAIGSYFVVGYEELLCKQLKSLEVEVEWAALPLDLGGFPAYYKGYARPLNSSEILLSPSVLTDGKWISDDTSINMFAYAQRADGSQSNQVAAQSTLSYGSVVQFHKPLLRQPQEDFAFTPSTLSGLFKLSLDQPEGAFGHQEYPNLLAQTLTANARQKNLALQQALPKSPYTPEIKRIVLNYQAFAVISFEQGRGPQNEQEQEKMIHLHPFGVESMAALKYRDIYQLPQYAAPGNLLIGLKAEQLSGPLSLYFYLREDSLPMTGIADSGLCWHYLSGNIWQRLPKSRLMMDATDGFMTSGIVTLDIPDAISDDNTIMPGGLYWLRVSADAGMERFCSVYSVYAQAIKVTWHGDEQSKTWAVLPALSINRSKVSLPGVDSILQVRKSFGGNSRESVLQYRTRVSERLRHKNRAWTAADYEMLILEAFPQIHKVKCFANLRLSDDPQQALSPGHILIIAIPYLTPGGHSNQKPVLSGHLIHEVAQMIRKIAPPFATISVENPVYEEIQVRCHIRLKAGLRGGWYNTRITQALCEFISPWHPLGYQQHFGWVIRQHDLISYLLDLDYVDSVSGFSLLRIAPKTGANQAARQDLYALHDNAKASQKDIRPVFPWSIAVPMNHHWIVLEERPDSIAPVPVGIDELEIGATFIIPSRTEP